MLSVIAAGGQAEREGMLERLRDGIAKAKREGRYRGRVPMRSSVSRRRASGPRKSLSGWGSAEPVCIGCWECGPKIRWSNQTRSVDVGTEK